MFSSVFLDSPPALPSLSVVFSAEATRSSDSQTSQERLPFKDLQPTRHTFETTLVKSAGRGVTKVSK